MPTPADRGPGRPWRPGTPPPTPVDPDLPSTDVRTGYARCSALGQEPDSPLDALGKHGIPRGEVFSGRISTRVRVRPAFEEALPTTREVTAPHAPHRRVVLTVYGMKRLGRDAAELTALAGPRPGAHDPTGPGRPSSAFLAAMAETGREDIREPAPEGLDTAARRASTAADPRSSPTTRATPCSGAARATSPSSGSGPA